MGGNVDLQGIGWSGGRGRRVMCWGSGVLVKEWEVGSSRGEGC